MEKLGVDHPFKYSHFKNLNNLRKDAIEEKRRQERRNTVELWITEAEKKE